MADEGVPAVAMPLAAAEIDCICQLCRLGVKRGLTGFWQGVEYNQIVSLSPPSLK